MEGTVGNDTRDKLVADVMTSDPWRLPTTVTSGDSTPLQLAKNMRVGRVLIAAVSICWDPHATRLLAKWIDGCQCPQDLGGSEVLVHELPSSTDVLLRCV